jgi:hypothetical protein
MACNHLKDKQGKMTSETNTSGPGAHPAKEASQQHLLTLVRKKIQG